MALEIADQARAVGDEPRELAALEQALAFAGKPNAALLLRKARIERGLGLTDESAQTLTKALRIDPDNWDAANALSLLATLQEIEEPNLLDPFGLANAFKHRGVEWDTVGDVALEHVIETTPFGGALVDSKDDTDDAARFAITNARHVLSPPLLHTVLRHAIIERSDVEDFLTAIRRHLLLHAPPDVFSRKDVFEFALSLVAQCWLNEHVYAETAEETDAILKLEAGMTAAPHTSSDVRGIMLLLLYRPLSQIDPACLGGIPAKALRTMVDTQVRFEQERKAIEAAIPSTLASSGSVTGAVGQHYEASPYPKWLSFYRSPSGIEALLRFFTKDELAFTQTPFRTLVAGAGTGRHALSSALRYGPGASILAVDLSRASLSYAAMKARELGIGNVTFRQADLHALNEPEAAFDIIEAVGVLHHTADPFRAWAAVLRHLKPGGLMWLGLYSAVSRQNISRLRQDPRNPGSNATDAEARAFRQVLLRDKANPDAQKVSRSSDFYTLSGFRDLVLNAHEIPVTLPEIETFLAANRLEFRGFVLPHIWSLFSESYPAEAWPGRLSLWAEFEDANPSAFDTMYQFWCRKTP